jgi:hypothetical protein
MDHVKISSVFLYLCIHAHRSSVLHYSDGMNYLVADGANSLKKGRVWWCPWILNPSSWALHPHVPPPSRPTPLVSLEKLLASQNAIMQRLAAIDDCKAEQSQQHHQPQQSTYFDFLATQPPLFTETTNLLEANHWLCVTVSKFGLLYCSEFQKTPWCRKCLVGHIYYHYSRQSPSVVGWVLQSIPLAPPSSRNHASQPTRVHGSTARDRQCVWVHQKVQLPGTIRYSSCWNRWEEGRAVQKRTEPSTSRSLSLVLGYVIQHPCKCPDCTRWYLPSSIGRRRVEEKEGLVRTFRR